ncbi:MAG: YihY/virulence factor BrkB family protein [Acidobacteriota bacterium]
MQLSAPPAPAGSILAQRLKHTFHYWMQTEVHVFGFSIAANVLLSFFPFLIVIYSLCDQVLGFRSAGDAIDVVLRDFLPTQMGELVSRNLKLHRSLQIASILLLLFTANGVFEPLEVALNKCWGITKNRTFVKNQLVSLGLIFICGTLGLASSVLTGLNAKSLGEGVLSQWQTLLFFKMAAVPMSILMLFLIYWLLPNAKISAKSVIPPAIFVGLGLEALKYINLLMWPVWRTKLRAEYGPFYFSVTIILWSFFNSMIILAGGEWAARSAIERRNPIATAEP